MSRCALKPAFAVLNRYLPHVWDSLPRCKVINSRRVTSLLSQYWQQCRLQAEVLEECLCRDQCLCGTPALARRARNQVETQPQSCTWHLYSGKCSPRNGIIKRKGRGESTGGGCRISQLQDWKCSLSIFMGKSIVHRVMWQSVFLGMEFHEELHNLGTKEGLKGRKLSKAIESFAWNITVLKVSTESTSCLILTL